MTGQPSPYSTSAEDLRLQLRKLRAAARAYLAARDRVDPAAEKEARDRLVALVEEARYTSAREAEHGSIKAGERYHRDG